MYGLGDDTNSMTFSLPGSDDSGGMPFTNLTYGPTDAQLLGFTTSGAALPGTTASKLISGTSSALSSSMLWMAAGVGLLFVIMSVGGSRR